MKKSYLLHSALRRFYKFMFVFTSRVVNIDIYISSSAGGAAIQQSGGNSPSSFSQSHGY